MLTPPLLYGAETKSYRIENSYPDPANRPSEAMLIKTALLSGFSGFDSAAINGYDEESAAAAFTESGLSRDEVWFQSKFTPPVPEYRNEYVYNVYAEPREQVRQSLVWSLNTLHTTYLDSYIQHCPYQGIYENFAPKDLLFWNALKEMRENGLVNKVGISDVNLNFIKTLSAQTSVKPAIVQNLALRNIIEDLSEVEILEYCLENAITYQAVQLINRHKEFLDSGQLLTIAGKYGITTGQLLIKFAQSLGMNPILGSINQKHMEESVDINCTLTADELAMIANTLDIPDASRVPELYQKLQDGILLTVNEIISNLRAGDFSSPVLLSYIPKLDPHSLTEILIDNPLELLDQLYAHGAHFDLLNSFELDRICDNRIEWIINLRDQYNIKVEKLLLAAAGDKALFNSLVPKACMNCLLDNEITAILHKQPSFWHDLTASDIAIEQLLMHSLDDLHNDHFAELLPKVNWQLMDSNDIYKIILAKGEGVIQSLKHYEVDFSSLASYHLRDIMDMHGANLIMMLSSVDIPWITFENAGLEFARDEYKLHHPKAFIHKNTEISRMGANEITALLKMNPEILEDIALAGADTWQFFKAVEVSDSIPHQTIIDMTANKEKSEFWCNYINSARFLALSLSTTEKLAILSNCLQHGILLKTQATSVINSITYDSIWHRSDQINEYKNYDSILDATCKDICNPEGSIIFDDLEYWNDDSSGATPFVNCCCNVEGDISTANLIQCLEEFFRLIKQENYHDEL